MVFSGEDYHNNVMGCDDVECVTELVATRFGMLSTLLEGPRSKTELEDELDVSRSTIDRAVRSLESEDIVVREDGHVTLTPFGQIALDGYREFRTGLAGLSDAKPIIASVEADEPIPFGFFNGAEVVSANRQSPHRPIVALQQFLDDADSVRSIVTGLLPEYVDTYRTQVVDAGTTAEVVVRSPILDRLLATYWEPVNDTLSSDRFTIYEITDDPPYSLKIGVTDDGSEVALVTYNDQGVSGFIRTDSPVAVEWAERVYADVKSRANLIAPMD